MDETGKAELHVTDNDSAVIINSVEVSYLFTQNGFYTDITFQMNLGQTISHGTSVVNRFVSARFARSTRAN